MGMLGKCKGVRNHVQEHFKSRKFSHDGSLGVPKTDATTEQRQGEYGSHIGCQACTHCLCTHRYIQLVA